MHRCRSVHAKRAAFWAHKIFKHTLQCFRKSVCLGHSTFRVSAKSMTDSEFTRYNFRNVPKRALYPHLTFAASL